MRAKIKVGANVTQDFHFFKWPAEYGDVIFDVTPLSENNWNKCKCVAHGFGVLPNPVGSNENYGNGAVYTSISGLYILDTQGALIRPGRAQRTVIFDGD